MAKAEKIVRGPFTKTVVNGRNGSPEVRISIDTKTFVGWVKRVRDNEDEPHVSDLTYIVNNELVDHFPEDRLSDENVYTRVQGLRRKIAAGLLEKEGYSPKQASDLATRQENWPEGVDDKLPLFHIGDGSGRGRQAQSNLDLVDMFD